MHLHWPAKKNNNKTHLKKQNFMFNNLKNLFLFYLLNCIFKVRLLVRSDPLWQLCIAAGKLMSFLNYTF
jgi:hypothetical protein